MKLRNPVEVLNKNTVKVLFLNYNFPADQTIVLTFYLNTAHYLLKTSEGVKFPQIVQIVDSINIYLKHHLSDHERTGPMSYSNKQDGNMHWIMK